MTFTVSGGWATGFLAVHFIGSKYFFCIEAKTFPPSIPLYTDKKRQEKSDTLRTHQECWNYVR